MQESTNGTDPKERGRSLDANTAVLEQDSVTDAPATADSIASEADTELAAGAADHSASDPGRKPTSEGVADSAAAKPDTDTQATANSSAADPDTADSAANNSGTDSAEDRPLAGKAFRWLAPRRRWIIRIAVGAVALVLLAGSVTACILGWKLIDRDEVDSAARQAAETARAYAVTLTSIDSQHIDQNFTDVLNGATGEFKDTYSQSSNQLKSLLVQNNAVSKGTVVDSSIKSASKNRVEVMLFVDQEVTNSASPDPRIDRSRIVMTMERVGGRWLAGKVDMV